MQAINTNEKDSFFEGECEEKLSKTESPSAPLLFDFDIGKFLDVQQEIIALPVSGGRPLKLGLPAVEVPVYGDVMGGHLFTLEIVVERVAYPPMGRRIEAKRSLDPRGLSGRGGHFVKSVVMGKLELPGPRSRRPFTVLLGIQTGNQRPLLRIRIPM